MTQSVSALLLILQLQPYFKYFPILLGVVIVQYEGYQLWNQYGLDSNSATYLQITSLLLASVSSSESGVIHPLTKYYLEH